MSRIEHYPNVTATESNRSTKFSEVPTSGEWHIFYGKDHTEMGYFIDFEPIEDIPNDEFEKEVISLDQLFTQPKMTIQDWVDILASFGIDTLI